LALFQVHQTAQMWDKVYLNHGFIPLVDENGSRGRSRICKFLSETDFESVVSKPVAPHGHKNGRISWTCTNTKPHSEWGWLSVADDPIKISENRMFVTHSDQVTFRPTIGVKFSKWCPGRDSNSHFLFRRQMSLSNWTTAAQNAGMHRCCPDYLLLDRQANMLLFFHPIRLLCFKSRKVREPFPHRLKW
jgi:hypothetical protein